MDAAQGRSVQVDPMKPKMTPPGTKRLKLKCDTLLSPSAFKFDLRRYTKVTETMLRKSVGKLYIKVGRWNPDEPRIERDCSKLIFFKLLYFFAFNLFQLAPLV